MISVSDLRVDYDNTCAVHDLSFEIEPGEVYGLIGPNGAGKTSTMRSLMGLLEPTYGVIEICGVDLLIDPEAAQSEVGFMPDFPPMYDDLLVWEFLDLFAASYYVPKHERPDIIDRYLDLVKLTEKESDFCKDLSRGMRQRLMLAKTLIPNPQVLLLDEPASGLDPHGRADLRKIIQKLAERGKSVLVSSHILAEMNDFCTSIGIMEKGKMVVTGRVDEISARVRGAGHLVVEVLEGDEEFQKIVKSDSLAAEITRKGKAYEFVYEGDAAAAADLLARLVRARVRVCSFNRKTQTLEDLFMSVGAQEVS